jgi:hypothetical protein
MLGLVKSIRDWALYAINAGATCFDCGCAISVADIRHYEHPDGWQVAGYEKRQWLYFLCPRQTCQYQTSFDKLRIPKS